MIGTQKQKPSCRIQNGSAVYSPPNMLPPNITRGLGAWVTSSGFSKLGVGISGTAPYHPKHPSPCHSSATHKDTCKTVYYKTTPPANQKALTPCQNSLIRWAADSHRTRRGEQSGFQSVTRLSGFTHQAHRIDSINSRQNKNNTSITESVAFGSLWSTVLPIETRINKYSSIEKPVKSFTEAISP